MEDRAPLWEAIGQLIGHETGESGPTQPLGHVGGGDINQAMRVRHGGSTWFVKLNRAALLGMFEAEADGLRELAEGSALRSPRALGTGTCGDSAFLVLEYLDFGGRGSAAELGEGLALQHRVTRPEHGWFRDNTIGATPQHNGWSGDWPSFWRERRLGYQLRVARERGHGGRLMADGERLHERCDRFFESYRPQPSLLHGDLWGGNYAYLVSGEPVIFDPAVYFGDRETDLAMTELFGGFGSEFYAAYRATWPLDPGYGVRKLLYQLYHILNHLNLFGGGYRSSAERLMARLLAEV